MNLWALVSTIIVTLGLTSSPAYHLPLFSLQQSETGDRIVLSEKVFEAEADFIPHKINKRSLGVKITADAAVVMDKGTGTILWEKNSHQVRSLASITKLMTMLIFLEHNPGWNETVTMLPEDETSGATAHILRGEVVTVKDLFNAALVSSDNNSANALVRSTGIEKEDFVKLMNNRADELGMNNTHFVGVTGLQDGNKSTVLDILKLATVAFANEDIKKATSQKSYSFNALSGAQHKLNSTNHLLSSYLDIVAGKTGYINAAGYCLVAEIEGEDGQTILSVVLGSDSNPDRFKDLKILSGWVLENYSWY